MRSTFWRDSSPWRTVTARRGSSSASARNSHNATEARPSTGGAWTFTFKASPSQPQTSLRGAFGIALIGQRAGDRRGRGGGVFHDTEKPTASGG